MKKLIYLLILPLLLIACNGGNTPTPPPAPTQDYTSFVFKMPSDSDVTWLNCKVGYFQEDRKCKLIADLGDIRKGSVTKEIKLPNEDITDIYFFYQTFITGKMLDKPYKLEKKKKNIFEFLDDVNYIDVNKDNEYEYPH
ncbi:hypothetical protein D0T49_12160 [Paludibacter sp. 221]|uniref:hypothetical protein n=1 Tax=Paludibacter sp. 221 TaxID=2302939 RepID=UPI0013D4025B|nr:hypothetical protein [Paludibacter sp. 221]NDV47800.1 hypothetical protein [Paludibacter sp. 221]